MAKKIRKVAPINMSARNRKGYHYTESGLDYIYLANGYSIENTPYGKGVSISDVNGLHHCIAKRLVDKPTPLTGAEFRFLRLELDLSQRLIGELFGRTEREVRKWEASDEVKEPFNRLVRHIYLERENPKGTFENLYERLRQIDVDWHDELRLEAEDGRWCAG